MNVVYKAYEVNAHLLTNFDLCRWTYIKIQQKSPAKSHNRI